MNVIQMARQLHMLGLTVNDIGRLLRTNPKQIQLWLTGVHIHA